MREAPNANPIAELRVQRGLTQHDLASMMGWKGKQAHLRVSGVECGREWLGDAAAAEMAGLLGVSETHMRRLLYWTWRNGYFNRRNRERRGK